MFKNELKSLWRNKLLIVIMAAIVLIPSIYAGFFLQSMWDPYGDMGNLPVAVVNKDQAVTYHDKELTVGADLAESLEENDSMAFNVVDEDVALKGLENGTYYMVITIPTNFSENATTLMDENPQQMILSYKTNPGKNYISMKLSESAMKQIKANLTEEITRTYTEAVFDSLKDVEDGFGEAVDGTQEMLDGEDQLVDGNKQITDNLVLLADGSNTLAEGTTTLASGAAELNSNMPALTSGAGQLADGVNRYTEGVGQLAGGVAQLKNGSASLAVGAKQVSDGVGTLAESLSGMTTTVAQQTAAQKQAQQTYGAKVAADKVAVTTSTKELVSKSASTGVGVGIQSAATAYATGIGALASSVTIPADPNAYVPQQATVSGNAVAPQQAGGSSFAQAYALGYAQALNDAVGVITATTTNPANLSATDNAKLSSKATLATLLASQDPAVNTTLVETLAVSNAVTTLANDAGQLGGATGALTVLESIGASDMSKLPQLVAGAKAVADGASQLDAGLTTAKGGADTLTGNSPALVNGAAGLSTGTVKVADAVGQIEDGANQLNDGALTIADGAGQLADGSKELGEGLDELQEGTTTLHDALADGKDEIAENEASDQNIDMFVAPVDIEEETITKVENNGHAMAAYMFSVGLWVAVLAFCLMYPLTEYHGEFKNGFFWWFSKAFVAAGTVVVMSTMLMICLSVFNGFSPQSMVKTWLVAMVAGMTFMCIQYFFDVLLGKVGSFCMLIFMVLQLTGSAGTYPIELSGSLANTLHAWMPFTYSVDAFRATISGAADPWNEVFVMFGISLVFTIFTIFLFDIRGHRIKQGKGMVLDWIEAHGLG